MDKEEIRKIIKEILEEEGIERLKVGKHTLDFYNDGIHCSASTPYIKFEGTEANAKTLTIRENAGYIEIYDEDASAVRTKWSGTNGRRNTPLINASELADGCLSADATGRAKMADGFLSADANGRAKMADGFITYAKLDANTKRFTVGIRIPADSAAGDTWERAAFYANTAVTVIDAGIVPDASFGQDTNYAILEVQNKGTDGTGTTSLVSKSFDSAVSAYDYTSLGTISNASVSAGEVLTFKKTIGGSGQIVPASLLVLVLERSA